MHQAFRVLEVLVLQMLRGHQGLDRYQAECRWWGEGRSLQSQELREISVYIHRISSRALLTVERSSQGKGSRSGEDKGNETGLHLDGFFLEMLLKR